MTVVGHAEESGYEFTKPGMVKVEQSELVKEKPPSQRYTLKPYRERRTKWGSLVGITYSAFVPSSYAPNYISEDFSSIYGNVPLMEGQLIVKRNTSVGSIGLEIIGGSYTNKSTSPELLNSVLSLTEVRLGFLFIADTLFSEPYAAPYVSGGAYTFLYKETLASVSYSGNTQVAPYLTLGIQAQLDWLDRRNAQAAYFSGGIESTFLFVEAKMYFASADRTDPQFQTPLQPAGGLRLEF
jgi:hypothetical protein